MVNLKRKIVLFGCAAAFAVAPLLAASPAAAKDCPPGTAPTRWPGVCSPGQVGAVGQQGLTVPPQSAPPGADVVYNPNGFSTVNGLPCTPERIGTCIALQQSQG